jgi:hypothetical protein
MTDAGRTSVSAFPEITVDSPTGRKAAVTTTAPQRPAWMKSRDARQKPGSSESRASRSVAVVTEPESTSDEPKKRWSWFGVEFGWGLVVSTLLHVTALGALSVLVFRHETKPVVMIQGIAGIHGGDSSELDLPGDSALDEELASAAATPIEFIDLSAVTSFDPTKFGPAAPVGGALGGDGNGEGTGFGGDGSGGMAGNVRVPSTAITKGSFTVWTDPEDPRPGQKYDIVIQIKVPTTITSYRLRDLTGTVKGTDTYFKAIKFKSTERKAVKDGVVQVRVDIPGAAQLVRDTIQIRSAVLKEEQTIQIVF